MALNSFQFTGGANASIGVTPTAFQITGPTVVVSNVGTNTCYGSLGGSASTTLNPASYISGQVVGGSGGGNSGTGVAGIAIPPGEQVTLAAGGNSWLWLATLAGVTAVNISNGT